MGRKDSLPEDAPPPRLCVLVKWPHFQGYGFNLHSEKNKEGQFIGKVDHGSPAEACGLLEGDQIVEVNGVNTSNENHKQVVERIKANHAQVTLLVVDPKAAEYYKKRNVVVKSSMANVKRMKTPGGGQDQETGESETSSQTQLSIEDTLTLAAQGSREESPPPVPPKTELSLEPEPPSSASAAAEPAEPAKPAEPAEQTEAVEKAEPAEPAEPAEQAEPAPASPSPAEQPAAAETDAAKSEPSSAENGKSESAEKEEKKETEAAKQESPRIDTSLQVESTPERSQPSPAPSAGSSGTVESAKSNESGPAAGEPDKFGLKLNMSAAEMREYLKTKKRHDPRNDNLSFKRRHEIVSNM